MLRVVCAVVFLGWVACASVGTQSLAVEDETHQKGVAGVSKVLAQASSLLMDKRYDDARALLVLARKRLQDADMPMRNHPAFSDLQEQVLLLMKQLESGEMQQKTGSRMALQSSLIERGEQVMQQGHRVLAEMPHRPASEQDVGVLKTCMEALLDLEKKGHALRTEQRYRDHAAKLSETYHLFYRSSQAMAWTLQVGHILKPSWEVLRQARIGVEALPQDAVDVLPAYEKWMQAALDVQKVLKEQEAQRLEVPSGLMALGAEALSFQQVLRSVQEQYNRAYEESSKLKWKEAMASLVQPWAVAFEKYQQSTQWEEALKAHVLLGEALSGCSVALERLGAQKWADFGYVWPSPWGERDWMGLRKECRSSEAFLVKEKQAWLWVKEVEGVYEDVVLCRKASLEAQNMVGVLGTSAMWADVQGCFHTAQQKLQHLLAQPAARNAYQVEWDEGVFSVEDASKRVDLEAKRAEDAYADAQKNIEKALFEQTCKADERTVLKHYGHPLKVQAFPYARVFQYPSEHIGFDLEGRKQDYATPWKQQAVVLVKSLNASFVPHVHQVASVKVLQKYQEALKACQEHFDALMQPGLDLKATFAGPWGVMSASQFAHVCKQQRARVAKKNVPSATNTKNTLFSRK
jgi:hypothetical protein